VCRTGPVGPFSLAFTHTPEGTAARSPFEFSAEVITGTPHAGTHIDALIHVQANVRVYGGHWVSEVLNEKGWNSHRLDVAAREFADPPTRSLTLCPQSPPCNVFPRPPSIWERA
jgi:hypothetical protein